ASGATFDAMRSTLGFGTLTQEQINDAYRGLMKFLTELDPNVRVEIANAVWANEGVAFEESFSQAVTASFDARVESLDFADPAAPTAISAWVEQHAEGLIDHIVDRLDPSLVMLLMNAVHFDGTWTTEFDPAKT